MTNGLARRHLRELIDLAGVVADLLAPDMEVLAQEVSDVLGRGGTIFFCGNGGSAADAQHLAAEYVVRFRAERRPLPAIALTTDTSILTAAANDFGFETVFARQLEALGRRGDLVFLHSTSGESENLLRVAETARAMKIQTVAFLAKGGGRLASMVDRSVLIPTDSTARAQEMHLALGHIVCALVEARVAGGEE